MENMKYPIPLYLNQGFVFDILAMMEDGFTQFTTLKTTSKEQQSKSNEISGEVGASNVFAFLGLKFGGKRQSKAGSDEAREAAMEKVHTPNSLFARLRDQLSEENAIKTLDSIECISTGDFVEFKTILHMNPLLETFESFLTVFRMVKAFETPVQPKKGVPTPKNESKQIIEQLEILIRDIRGGGTVDLVGTSVVSGISAVLTLYQAFLRDETLSNLIDGEFTVLGKVVRIVGEESEPISLLRNTSFGSLSEDRLQLLIQGMSEASKGMSEAGLKVSELKVVIGHPAVQVLPIAIYS
jgi:hypothetical protein